MPDPEWYSINFGVALCIECSGIHRSLGVHVSKVRSISLDALDPCLLKVLGSIGNDYFNSIYEGALTLDSYDNAVLRGVKPPKPSKDSQRDLKEDWIRLKYVDRAFLAPFVRDLSGETINLSSKLIEAASKDDIVSAIPLLAAGADVNFKESTLNGSTALHIACRDNKSRFVEYLLVNNAISNVIDNNGFTPHQIAQSSKAEDVLQLFKRKGHV